MQISIETDKLIELELSPTEYVVLQLLWQKEYNILEGLCVARVFEWTNDSSFLGILQHLEYKGYLKITQALDFKFQDIVLRQKADSLFEVNSDHLYLKLFNIFPMKVSDGNGGYRVLKAKSIESEDYKKGLKLWKEILKKEDADVVIKALEKQLEVTRSKLQYTQNFLTWLRQKTYQKYKDLTITKKQETTEEI